MGHSRPPTLSTEAQKNEFSQVKTVIFTLNFSTFFSISSVLQKENAHALHCQQRGAPNLPLLPLPFLDTKQFGKLRVKLVPSQRTLHFSVTLRTPTEKPGRKSKGPMHVGQRSHQVQMYDHAHTFPILDVVVDNDYHQHCREEIFPTSQAGQSKHETCHQEIHSYTMFLCLVQMEQPTQKSDCDLLLLLAASP